MKSKLLQQQRLWFPAIVLFVFGVSWHFAFRPTYLAWQEHQKLSGIALSVTSQTSQPDYSARSLKEIKLLLNKYSVDTATLRDKIVFALSGPTEGARIVKFPSPQKTEANRIGRQDLELQGNFDQLLRALRLLEGRDGIGVIRSASFITEKNNSTPGGSERLKLNITFNYLNN